MLEPGCVLVCWPFEQVAGKVSIRVQELFVTCETKTSDNVFVTVNVSLQYMAVREKIYAAFYTLEDPLQQMKSYVFDVLRAALCQMTLDQSFESKEEISHSIKSHLEEVMHGYGYTILNAVVTDLSPDARVREAMNEINASKRLKEVAEQRAEGEKVIKVKRAQAESESMYLSGCGVARQRKAIMDGLKETITEFGDKVKDTTTKEIMDMIVLNQYFDTLQEIGHNPVTKTVFLPSDNDKLRTSILQADAAKL